MKKFILVSSDIHNDSDVFQELCTLASDENCIAFLYAGDLDVDDYFIGSALRKRNFTYISVLGNCDNLYDFISCDIPSPKLFTTCTFNGKKIFMTHGHYYSRPNDVSLEDKDFDIVITGHTHRSSIIKENGVYYINPGSPSRPRGCKKSYIIIEFDNDDFKIVLKEF